MEHLKVKLTGTVPLLMHNERMANPLDPAQQAMKAATDKRKKTLDDTQHISYLEFKGGIYADENGPFIPSSWLHATIKSAAKLTRKGTDVSRALWITSIDPQLEYEGPRDVDDLWKAEFYDRRMVGNQRARVLRTRPRFNVWSVEFELMFDESVFDAKQIKAILETAGKMTGLGDYRPTYGRFDVEFLH